MEKVKQTVLVTASGRGEDWTLDAVWTLDEKKENLNHHKHVCKHKRDLFCKRKLVYSTT